MYSWKVPWPGFPSGQFSASVGGLTSYFKLVTQNFVVCSRGSLMPTLSRKALFLLKSGRSLPQRVRNKVDGWMDRFSEPCNLQNVRLENELLQGLSHLGLPGEWLAEEKLLLLEKHLASAQLHLADPAPFGTFHNGTITLGRLCYAACRAIRPADVVETGVPYGFPSPSILQPLSQNCTVQ